MGCFREAAGAVADDDVDVVAEYVVEDMVLLIVHTNGLFAEWRSRPYFGIVVDIVAADLSIRVG